MKVHEKDSPLDQPASSRRNGTPSLYALDLTHKVAQDKRQYGTRGIVATLLHAILLSQFRTNWGLKKRKRGKDQGPKVQNGICAGLMHG
jgi:hypothetical protein